MILRAIIFCFILTSTLYSSEKFDWSSVLEIPPGSGLTTGNQILHFKSVNKHFSENEAARLFVESSLKNALPLTSDAEVLHFGSDHVKIKGLFIELGVCTGKTINFLAALNPHEKIYGFDSFEGLPEDWIRADKIISAGTFGFKNPDILPPVLHNVELIKGWFSETLAEFQTQVDPLLPIALLHVDCDIYSSTANAFQLLGSRIQPGTIIVFDEFYNYPGCEQHEMKALQEFLERTGYQVRFLAYNVYHEQVALEIVAADAAID